MSDNQFPKLRPVDARPIVYGGRPSILLRDPIRLSDRILVIPRELGPLLALCDGTNHRDALWATLSVEFGVPVTRDYLDELLAALDEALLLDNERAAQARGGALDEYLQAPFRPPTLMGQSYPADPDELRGMLRQYMDAAADVRPAPAGGRGLVSPHIDYERGGSVYARVWKRASEMAREADLVVILGTDHHGGNGQLTLTRQHYATPFGVLPLARDVVDALAESLGPEAAFADELHHRSEHSIELAAVWLHYVREERPCEVVPILCGSFEHFVQNEAEPGNDAGFSAFLDALQRATAGRRMMVVSAADLSHVGPAFGGQPLDLAGRAWLKVADAELMDRMCAGDAEGFFGAVKRVTDRYNVCGLPPTYLALRILSPVRGERVAYDRCPADESGTSLVSVCGVVFD